MAPNGRVIEIERMLDIGESVTQVYVKRTVKPFAMGQHRQRFFMSTRDAKAYVLELFIL